MVARPNLRKHQRRTTGATRGWLMLTVVRLVFARRRPAGARVLLGVTRLLLVVTRLLLAVTRLPLAMPLGLFDVTVVRHISRSVCGHGSMVG